MHHQVEIVSQPDQIPRIIGTTNEVFLDVETASFDDSRGGVKPYHGDQICGISLTVDRDRRAWYLPMRHRDHEGLLPYAREHQNLSPEVVRKFVQDLLGDPNVNWINHNIKFDAHFLAEEGINIKAKMIDTLTLAKVVDMQSQLGGYGLKPLAKSWCDMETDEQDEVKRHLRAAKSKDFARVDIETLGKYACADVIMNRKLWKAIKRKRYDDIEKVWSIETELTRTLFNIERRGLRVDQDRLRQDKIDVETEIARIEFEVERLGHKVDLNSPEQVIRFITKTLGLPVVAETDRGRPSINSEALTVYTELVEEQPNEVRQFFSLLEKHRDRSQYLALYLRGWSEWIDHRGIIRPMYQQTVRSGRMSCNQPNVQQLSSEAKSLISPAPGNSFLRRDYSQIEYRVIASICRDQKAIAAYKEDPTTDFHTFVAHMCGIQRKPAKSVNFGIAFGMGESKLVRQLSSNMASSQAESQAKQILRTYHATFPTIKATASLAERRAKTRGWIRTLYGRRRALDDGFTHKAFNSAVQGTAADIMKEQVIALETDQKLRSEGISIRAVVHDEVLFEGPTEAIECSEIQQHIEAIMCNPTVDLGVPLLTDGNHSSISWADASD